MTVLVNITYGLALFFILWSVVLQIGGRRFWDIMNMKKTAMFIVAGLYVFGAVCACIAADLAYTSGTWYGAYAKIIVCIFEILFIVLAMMRMFIKQGTWAYIEERFRLNLFFMQSTLLGCCGLISYMLLHGI